MHELAAVGTLVDAVLAGITEHQPCRVDAIHVQRGTAFLEAALLQGFEMLARGTALEGAKLQIEVVDHTIDCPCGIERPILAEELVGHVWVCPNCGHLEEIDEEDDLSLLGVTLTPLAASVRGRGR
jgi:Zn finger protein HypA/HybF involved in hydrogenase expression